MSASLIVEFNDGSGDFKNPMVYLHWGGEHSQDVKFTCQSFLDEVAALPDPRLDDASYLAAKLVVWAAMEFQVDPISLDFMGVGIVADAGWGDAHAVIDCDKKPGTFTILKSIDMETH